MARGEQGKHLKAKNKFVECADEVYVVSPLGKVFVTSEARVNQAMGLQGTYGDPEEEPYKDVFVNDEKAKIVKLVSTAREQDTLLHDHSVSVRASLGQPGIELPSVDLFAAAEPADVPHLFFAFPPSVRTYYEELELEFPHSRTRVPSVLNMFQVKDQHRKSSHGE